MISLAAAEWWKTFYPGRLIVKPTLKASRPRAKIVVAGTNNGDEPDIAITRYNGDGSLDNSFDSDGYVEAGLRKGRAITADH